MFIEKLKINMKQSPSGITLIALVVMIIILIILASITLGTLWGENGLLKNASVFRYPVTART